MESLEAAFPRSLSKTVIKDLLWACVVCGAEESLRPRDKHEVCAKCGAVYARGTRSNIVVKQQGRAAVEKSAREWEHLLPAVSPRGSAPCTIRMNEEDRPIRAYGKYMGRYEHFGEPSHGVLTVDAEAIRFDGERAFNWSLLDLTAIQLSSSTLQLKATRQPLVMIRFDTSSPKMWEERLQLAVRAAYARAGRGDVVEFQPRIVTR